MKTAATSHERLAKHLKVGHVYRRDMLASYSKAVDRDLAALLTKGLLEKVAPGLYYKPLSSRFGILPPNDWDLIKSFLKDDEFLLFSWDTYNALGVGLTQLYNRMVVYNYKRHGVFKLGNKFFDFRRPVRGFPKKLSPEFLLVDLVNNMAKLTEDTDLLKNNIKKKLAGFDRKKLIAFVKKYGKIATKYFFEEIPFILVSNPRLIQS